MCRLPPTPHLTDPEVRRRRCASSAVRDPEYTASPSVRGMPSSLGKPGTWSCRSLGKRQRFSTSTLGRCMAAMIVLTSAPAGAAQDSLVVARDLYTAAAYEDALKVLDGLKVSQQSAADSRSIEQYRAFCLIALGRKAD